MIIRKAKLERVQIIGKDLLKKKRNNTTRYLEINLKETFKACTKRTVQIFYEYAKNIIQRY